MPNKRKRRVNTKETKNVAKAGAVGGAAGAGVYTAVGGAGLAVGGTAIALTIGAYILAGSVVAAAGYGVYRLMTKPEDEPTSDQPQ